MQDWRHEKHGFVVWVRDYIQNVLFLEGALHIGEGWVSPEHFEVDRERGADQSQPKHLPEDIVH